jgi:hypothetical protein
VVIPDESDVGGKGFEILPARKFLGHNNQPMQGIVVFQKMVNKIRKLLEVDLRQSVHLLWPNDGNTLGFVQISVDHLRSPKTLTPAVVSKFIGRRPGSIFHWRRRDPPLPTGQRETDGPEKIFVPVGVRRIDLYQGEGLIVRLHKLKVLEWISLSPLDLEREGPYHMWSIGQ